ncbi:MAG: type I-D CRISPR-associated protein Cas7/Csc2 [Trueperaceae bacterium]|nr:type I-D CRISPR-associated protein Cas7/Csc2 [Trueperaceae bacterium]
MFEAYEKHFHKEIPLRPGAKYAHILVLRKTESYAVFKTDGELNTARVNAGLEDKTQISRLTLFKRKQSTPERLTGREVLRRYDLLPSDDEYNVNFTPDSPDSVIYGYAIGDSGSEKSKVYVDTAFSLTSYDHSHETMTLNAPYEDGTMTRGGNTTNRFSEQDHVVPEVYFPSVVTVRDPTQNTLAYVLNNIRRTKRYGAQTTRTGQVSNSILGLVFADGEIFSNLKLVQAMHDLLKKHETMTEDVAMVQVAYELVKHDGVIYEFVMGDELESLLKGLDSKFTNEESLKSFLTNLYSETKDYAARAGTSKK